MGDEFGYLTLKPEQSNTFFKLMEERYHRNSTGARVESAFIITANLVYDEWHNFPGNKAMVDALLSRARPADAPPPGTVRSLAYFPPVVEEVLETQASPEYYR